MAESRRGGIPLGGRMAGLGGCPPILRGVRKSRGSLVVEFFNKGQHDGLAFKGAGDGQIRIQEVVREAVEEPLTLGGIAAQRNSSGPEVQLGVRRVFVVLDYGQGRRAKVNERLEGDMVSPAACGADSRDEPAPVTLSVLVVVGS